MIKLRKLLLEQLLLEKLTEKEKKDWLNSFFSKDPVRMLRYVAKNDVEKIPEIIKNSIENNSEKLTLDGTTKQKIRESFEKILMRDNPEKSIEFLKDTGLLFRIIPEFKEAVGMTQNKFHTKDVFGHTLDVLQNASKLSTKLSIRLMALLHDIGKTITRGFNKKGEYSFIQHENKGAEMTKVILNRLGYVDTEKVEKGVSLHMRLKNAKDSGYGDEKQKYSDDALLRFVEAAGDDLDDILVLIHADNISHSEHSPMPNQIENIKKRIGDIKEKEKAEAEAKKAAPKPVINGKDLIEMGIPEGPVRGILMKYAKELQKQNKEITKDETIEKIKTEFERMKKDEKFSKFFK